MCYCWRMLIEYARSSHVSMHRVRLVLRTAITPPDWRMLRLAMPPPVWQGYLPPVPYTRRKQQLVED